MKRGKDQREERFIEKREKLRVGTGRLEEKR